MQDSKGIYSAVGVPIFFAAVVIFRFHPVLKSFWLYDDPYILRHAIDHRPWEYFLVPDVWREMSMRYLTPWVTFSFHADLLVFGLQPLYFYFHQLVSIWIATMVLYIVLRLWLMRRFAVVGSLLFLFSAPVAAAAEMLQIRHYVEGWIFCLVSVYFFVAAVRKESLLHSAIAALFYLLAMSAKELYVPLLAVLLFLPEGLRGKRIIFAVPSAVVLVLYFVWRYWMLGDVIAGPGGESALDLYQGREAFGLLLKNVYGTMIMFAGASDINRWANPVAAYSLLISFGTACFLLIKKKRYSVIFFFVVMVSGVYSVPLAAYHPSFMLNDFPAYRLLFLVAACLSILFACSSSFLYTWAVQIYSGKLKILVQYGVACLVIIPMLFVCWNSSLWITTQRERVIKPLVQEGVFFMNANSHSLLIKTDPIYGGPHYFENLEYFRTKYYDSEAPSVVFGNFAHVDGGNTVFEDGFSIVKYDEKTGNLADYRDSFMRERSQYQSRLRKLPLSVKLTLQDGIIDFTMGPSNSGHYFLLWGHKPGVYSSYIDLGLKRNTTTRGLMKFKIYWRFGWESPEGLVTLSPEWFVDFSKTQVISWEQR